MMSTSARAAALLTAALLVGSSATAATAAVGQQVRTSTVTAGGQVRTSTTTAGEPVSMSAAAAVTMTSKPKPKPKPKPKLAKGFHVVRELPHGAQAGLSPARGELWLATGGGLEHLRAGRWTTDPNVHGGSLTGTSRDDVWLAAGTSLRRYDGRRWTTVALPTFDSGGQPVWFKTVESPRRGVLYAALTSEGWYGGSRVFRYAKGRWTALGAPDYDLIDHYVVQIKVVDGAVLTRSTSRWQNDYASYVGGKWTYLYGNGTPVDSFYIGGWYPRSYSNHLILGVGGSYEDVPRCQQWIGAWPLVDCTTTRATAASAQLKNGTIVLAGKDYYRDVFPWTGMRQFVEGGFGLRAPDGRETSLAGDPGDDILLVVAEAHRNAAWAVTGTYAYPAGWTYYLQRYDG